MTCQELGLAIAVLAASAVVDLAHARYVRALVGGHRHAAARWSVAQWGAASVGFVVAVRVSLWFLPLEAAGLYLGTIMGAPRAQQSSRSRPQRP